MAEKYCWQVEVLDETGASPLHATCTSEPHDEPLYNATDVSYEFRSQVVRDSTPELDATSRNHTSALLPQSSELLAHWASLGGSALGVATVVSNAAGTPEVRLIAVAHSSCASAVCERVAINVAVVARDK